MLISSEENSRALVDLFVDKAVCEARVLSDLGSPGSSSVGAALHDDSVTVAWLVAPIPLLPLSAGSAQRRGYFISWHMHCT